MSVESGRWPSTAAPSHGTRRRRSEVSASYGIGASVKDQCVFFDLPLDGLALDLTSIDAAVMR